MRPPRRLVPTPQPGGRSSRSLGRTSSTRRSSRALRQGGAQGAGQGPPAGLRQADHHRRRDSLASSATPRCSSGPDAHGPEDRGRPGGLSPTALSLPAVACRPTDGPCWSATGSSTWPGRSSGWAAWAPAAGSPCSWAATTGPAASSRSRRPRPRCSSPTSARSQSTTSTANGWSRASGSCSRPATSSSAGSASPGSTAATHDYYFRQLWDWKASADIDAMDPAAAGRLRPDLRLHPRPGPRPQRRPACHLGLPGRRPVWPARWSLLRHLRRPERTGPRRLRGQPDHLPRGLRVGEAVTRRG